MLNGWSVDGENRFSQWLLSNALEWKYKLMAKGGFYGEIN